MKNTQLPPKIIIEVLGNVGSGKTTTALTIPKVSNCKYVDIDIYAENPFLPDYVKDPKRWTFTSDLFFSFERSKKISLVEKAIKQNPVVLDSGFDMGLYMYTRSCFYENKLNATEWEFFQTLHKHFMKDKPKLYASIFIDVPIDVLMDRIKKRGRVHEQVYTKEYLQQLQDGLDEYKKELINSDSREVVVTYHELEKSHTFHKKEDPRITEVLKSFEQFLPTDIS